MCKIHELAQCLVRLITDVPGHDQAGLARLVLGQTTAIFASPRLIASVSIAVRERELDLPAVRWSLNEEKWRVKFVQHQSPRASQFNGKKCEVLGFC